MKFKFWQKSIKLIKFSQHNCTDVASLDPVPQVTVEEYSKISTKLNKESGLRNTSSALCKSSYSNQTLIFHYKPQ